MGKSELISSNASRSCTGLLRVGFGDVLVMLIIHFRPWPGPGGPVGVGVGGVGSMARRSLKKRPPVGLAELSPQAISCFSLYTNPTKPIRGLKKSHQVSGLETACHVGSDRSV